MKTSIRAHRIVEDIQNYHKADGSSHPFLGSTSDFGEPIGYYKNPGPDGEVVEIYTEGLHWSVGDEVFEVFFREIDRVQPTDAKESKHIINHTKKWNAFFHASKRAARKLLRFNGDARISRSSDQRQPTSIPRRSHRPRRVMRPNESPRYVFASPTHLHPLVLLPQPLPNALVGARASLLRRSYARRIVRSSTRAAASFRYQRSRLWAKRVDFFYNNTIRADAKSTFWSSSKWTSSCPARAPRMFYRPTIE